MLFAQEKPSPPVVQAMNKQLDRVVLGGFDSNRSSLSREYFQKWDFIAGPLIRSIAENIPEGFVLEIKGHANDDGTPEFAMQVSVNRAETLYKHLRRSGCEMKNISHKGVGGTEPLEVKGAGGEFQRRVTFRVVGRP